MRSDPPDGGMVPEGRTTLTLWFDEPVGTAASTFRLGTMAGLDVPTTVTFGDGDEEVLIMTAPLERGEYVLDWHALSTRGRARVLGDGGVRRGPASRRGVGRGRRAPFRARGGARVGSISAALLLVLGSVTVSGAVLAAAGPGADALRHRVRSSGLLAAWASLVAGLLTPVLRTRSGATSGSRGPSRPG